MRYLLYSLDCILERKAANCACKSCCLFFNADRSGIGDPCGTTIVGDGAESFTTVGEEIGVVDTAGDALDG